ncbi:hypothetical protein [Candidatus Lokiarchaeum ossiferum]|uniref:hypothetical protein n=1 Tax=Candidatus Lokiarchaeum ossiferum TaxID=2951803 RepID=UPI00352F173D
MKKIITMPLLALIIVSMFSSMAFISADDVDVNPENRKRYQGTIKGNESAQFKFQNRLTLQIRTNMSLDVDITCDCENPQLKNMTMLVNTTLNRKMTMNISNSEPELGLYDGTIVMAQNQHQYQFREQYIYNISLNGTDAVRAQLRTQCDDPMATWAYLNEETNVWVPVQSQYENGEVFADTTHFSIWTVLSSLPQGPKDVDVDHKFNGKVNANETNQFKFKNNFQFNFRANNSMEVDIECDEAVQAKTMEMNMNTSEQVRLQIRINNSNSDLGLTNGSTIKTQNRYRYQFMEGAIFNFSSNATDPFMAQLRYQVGEQNCTWAYYDEDKGEFVMVQSQLEDGYLIANTNHFSIWTILTINEVEDESTIPGYAFLGVFSILGLAAIILKKKH